MKGCGLLCLLANDIRLYNACSAASSGGVSPVDLSFLRILPRSGVNITNSQNYTNCGFQIYENTISLSTYDISDKY